MQRRGNAKAFKGNSSGREAGRLAWQARQWRWERNQTRQHRIGNTQQGAYPRPTRRACPSSFVGGALEGSAAAIAGSSAFQLFCTVAAALSMGAAAVGPGRLAAAAPSDRAAAACTPLEGEPGGAPPAASAVLAPEVVGPSPVSALTASPKHGRSVPHEGAAPGGPLAPAGLDPDGRPCASTASAAATADPGMVCWDAEALCGAAASARRAAGGAVASSAAASDGGGTARSRGPAASSGDGVGPTAPSARELAPAAASPLAAAASGPRAASGCVIFQSFSFMDRNLARRGGLISTVRQGWRAPPAWRQARPVGLRWSSANESPVSSTGPARAVRGSGDIWGGVRVGRWEVRDKHSGY